MALMLWLDGMMMMMMMMGCQDSVAAIYCSLSWKAARGMAVCKDWLAINWFLKDSVIHDVVEELHAVMLEHPLHLVTFSKLDMRLRSLPASSRHAICGGGHVGL
jgi:hypothetical protein